LNIYAEPLLLKIDIKGAAKIAIHILIGAFVYRTGYVL